MISAQPAPCAETTLGGWRPGIPLGTLPGDGNLRWSPCLTRARDDEGRALAHPHLWWLEAGPRSLYCPTCRARRPRTVIGSAEMVGAISAALAAADLRRVRELVAAVDRGVRELAALPAPPPQAPGPAPAPRFRPRDETDWLEYYTERAAIAEYVGGQTRLEAEALARRLAGSRPRHYDRDAGPLFAGA